MADNINPMPDSSIVLSGKDRLRAFTLGVNNRILPPTRMVPKFANPLDDRIARRGGPYKDRTLRFPEFLALLNKEEVERGKETTEGEEPKMPQTKLLSLPLEMMYDIFDFLGCTDLSNLCLVSKNVNKIAAPVLYNNYSPVADFRYMRPEVLNKAIENQNVGLWKDWSLWLSYYFREEEEKDWDPVGKMMEHLSKFTALERLTFRGGFEREQDTSYMTKFFDQKFEKHIAQRVAPTIFPKLTSLLYYPTDPNYIAGILQHCTNLTTLHLICHSGGPFSAQALVEKYRKWGTLLPTIARTVGNKLRYLTIDHRIHDPDVFDKFIQPLTSKDLFPVLEVVTIVGNRWEERRADVDPFCARYMPLLLRTCRASIAHGGWKIDKLQHVLNIAQFAKIEDPKDARMLVNWLRSCPWPKLPYGERLNWQLKQNRLKWPSFMDCPTVGIEEVWDDYITIDRHMMGDLDHPTEMEDTDDVPAPGVAVGPAGQIWPPDEERTVAELSVALKKVVKLFTAAEIPLKLNLFILRPHWVDNPFNIKSRVWELLPPNLAGLKIHPIACETVDSIQDSSDDWMGFLDSVLPRCHNLKAFRIKGAGDLYSPIFFPAKHAKAIHDLVHDHSLREFDLDLGALMQPATFLHYTSEDLPTLGADIQAPRMVVQQLLWISTPEVKVKNMPNTPLMLDFLTTLTLRSVFIYREVEMIWICNIPIKLKFLEHLVFEGIVWAIGFDPEKDIDQRLEALPILSDDEDDGDDDDDYGGDDDDEGKVREKGKGKEKDDGKGKGKGKAKEGPNGDDEEEEEKEPVWFKPKHGDYAKYHLEKDKSEDEEVKVQRRKERTRKRNLNRRKKKKAAAAAAAAGGTVGAGAPSDSDSEDTDSEAEEATAKSHQEANKSSKNKKKKASLAEGSSDSALPQPPPPPISTNLVLYNLESQLTRFNLGENNEIKNKVPIDDGLLSWLGVDKNMTTPPSSPSISSSSSPSDAGSILSGGPTIISSASTTFGSDPRFAEMTNIRLRIARHRDWFVRMLLKGSKSTGGQLRTVIVRHMRLNGKGQKVYRFNPEGGGDLNPFEEDWSDEDDFEGEGDEGWDDEVDEDEDDLGDEFWEQNGGGDGGYGGHAYYDGIEEHYGFDEEGIEDSDDSD
ncbi:hypothetical protein DFH27DRAFT_654221 [Peziza echinospora]|nr:hypothetical protein DFH27DRAFT_654221 [Peziza echinospora]